MRCNASPTISIAVEPAREFAKHEAAVRFSARLFGAALKPMSATLGFFGDVALDATASALARRERLLSAIFERMLR